MTTIDYGMILRDYCYAYFGWAGKGLASMFKGIEKDLESACMHIHSEVYFSMVGLLALVSGLIPLTMFGLITLGVLRLPIDLGISPVVLVPVSFGLPLIIIIGSTLLPGTVSSNRMSSLQIEIPYASMYVSVMVSGGLSPFESFLRMKHMNLLPSMKQEIERLETIVMSTGADPVTAMEQAAKTMDLKDYKELLLGYASSVRTGGDTLHYLFNQTQNMFRNLAIQVKAKGETAAMLMEAYTIIGILGVLGIFLVFVVGMSLPTAGASISPEQFFLFSFIVMPLMSGLFLFAGDMTQFNYPVSNWKPYYVFFGLLPFGGLLSTQIVLPFFSESFLRVPALMNFIIWVRVSLGFAEGTEAAIGVVFTLIFVALPGWIADYYSAGRDGNLQDGITNFMRDLVEVRKSGMSPEKSIAALASRDYKGFSRYLKDISTKINWGYPIRQVYEEFASKVNNWIALVNIYLLLDTIEVGGGTVDSIESLAEFSESSKQLESEKRAVLMPLIIVPYIGAALLTGTTVMFLGFFGGSNLGISVQTSSLYRVLLTPISIHCFTLGLVTGKIVSGRVSAGFKHAVILSLVALGGIWLVSSMEMSGGLI
ncbi:MAG: type II secretion system F family protein [Candidatus Bathyarchaeia archaeon]